MCPRLHLRSISTSYRNHPLFYFEGNWSKRRKHCLFLTKGEVFICRSRTWQMIGSAYRLSSPVSRLLSFFLRLKVAYVILLGSVYLLIKISSAVYAGKRNTLTSYFSFHNISSLSCVKLHAGQVLGYILRRLDLV